MTCLMLMEELPDLQIVGVDYEDTKALEGTEYEHLIGDYESMLLNPGSSSTQEEEKGEPQLSPPQPFVGGGESETSDSGSLHLTWHKLCLGAIFAKAHFSETIFKVTLGGHKLRLGENCAWAQFLLSTNCA